MKTKKFAFVLLAVALTLSAFATKTPKMDIVALDGSKAVVTAVTDSQESSRISIIDENGERVYFKWVKAAARFKTVFDLSYLEPGTYTVKFKTGTESVKREIEVGNGEVKVKPMKYKAHFAYDGNLLKVSYLNFEQKDISIFVYNGSQLVFQSDFGNDFNIQRALDVSQMVKGEFNFILAGAGEEFWYGITR
jgi:hypothetical protein